MGDGCIQDFVGETTWNTQGMDERIILKWILKKLDREAWAGVNLLTIGTGGGLLWMQYWTFGFGFNKMLSISSIAEDLLVSQEGICYMELVIIVINMTYFGYYPPCSDFLFENDTFPSSGVVMDMFPIILACYRDFPRRTPISNLHAHLQMIPILQFIYHLTDKFFVSCPAHPNPLIRNTGNYALEDLHRQYTKYTHKHIKHILL